MDEGYQWLEAIANRMKEEIDRGAAASPESLTVRDLLRKFGYESAHVPYETCSGSSAMRKGDIASTSTFAKG